MKKILLLGLIALMGCKKEVEEIKEVPHIFRTYEASIERERKHLDTVPLPPLPRITSDQYYSDHNIVIDSLGDLYYFRHNKPKVWICEVNVNIDSIYPAMFINLSPEKLMNVPNSKLDEFLNTTFPVNNEERIFLTIGSARDSFQSPELQKISDYLDKKLKHSIFIVRHTTQEESEVLKYKKLKIPYDHTQIKWDSARTSFKKDPLF